MLDFVEDGAAWVLSEEAAGVAARVLPDVDRFEGHPGQVGKHRHAERGLTRLPRPRNRDHGIVAGASSKETSSASLNHVRRIALPCMNSKSDLESMQRGTVGYAYGPVLGVAFEADAPDPCIGRP